MRMTIQAKDKANTIIADGKTEDKTVRVFENNWYFSPEQVDMTYLKITERTYHCPYKGTCHWIDLDAPDLYVKSIGWVYADPLPTFDFIKGLIAFYSRSTKGTRPVAQPVTGNL